MINGKDKILYANRMIKTKILIVGLFLIISFSISGNIYSQQSRLDALGGLSYSILDIDSQLDPFVLGGNPAWMVNSQKEQRLEITPYGTNSNGDYHRYFESGNISNYGVNFMGLKPLGKGGTFRGYAGYNYQIQKERNKVLTLTPYTGEAYFFTDTTSGDFVYSGPTFEFMHSLEIFDNFYFGASVNYQILDGLKKVYTYAQTLYRNVKGNVGIAYRFGNKFSVGLNYTILDSQERIEASDVNLFTVITYLYRGETYRVELRGSSQDFKLKKKGQIFGGQIFMNPTEKLFVGISAKYYPHNSSILIPQSSIVDHEDGYASFGQTDIKLQGRWIENNSLVFGFTGGYNYNNSWTRNSNNNLLIWEWDTSDKFLGGGVTFGNVAQTGYLVGAEYELHNINADSSKYIDNKESSLSVLNQIIRLGSEIKISSDVVLRLGYNLIFKEYDFLAGGNDVMWNNISVGAGINVSDNMEIDIGSYYFTNNVKDKADSMNDIGLNVTLRFNKF
jgi:hypothetical protein